MFILRHEVSLHVGGVLAGGEVLPLLVLVPPEAPLAVGGVGVLLGPAGQQDSQCQEIIKIHGVDR